MNVRIKEDFNAIGDGKTLNTYAIQSAINHCHNNGGGKVIVSDGIYMTGTIVLKSNVNLHITADAILLGSPNCEDFPERNDIQHVETKLLPRWKNACIIFAEECENISITGNGKIDCNGNSFVKKRTGPHKGWDYVRTTPDAPPRAVFFTGCQNVKIEDIMLTNSPAGWSFWIHDCDYVTFDKVKIISNVNYPNNDGIHVNCSRNVTISNCCITCGDDCIVVRANSVSLKENKICEKVVVTNCNLTSYSAGIRIGWLNDGVIKNCTFSNIVMTDTSVGIAMFLPHMDINKNDYTTADRGREATNIENILFSNIIMDKVAGFPIKIRIDDSEVVKCKTIRNIYFSNIHTSGPKMPVIEGRKDCYIENIYFNDCSFVATDGTEFDNLSTHGAGSYDEMCFNMSLKYINNLTLNNTHFDITR